MTTTLSHFIVLSLSVITRCFPDLRVPAACVLFVAFIFVIRPHCCHLSHIVVLPFSSVDLTGIASLRRQLSPPRPGRQRPVSDPALCRDGLSGVCRRCSG